MRPAIHKGTTELRTETLYLDRATGEFAVVAETDSEPRALKTYFKVKGGTRVAHQIGSSTSPSNSMIENDLTWNCFAVRAAAIRRSQANMTFVISVTGNTTWSRKSIQIQMWERIG